MTVATVQTAKTSSSLSRLRLLVPPIFMLGLFLLIDNPAKDFRGRSAFNCAVIASVWGGLVASLTFMLFSRNRRIRWGTCLLMTATLGLHFGLMRVNHEGFTFDMALLFLNSPDAGGDAVSTYWLMFLPIILACLVATFVVSQLVVRYVGSYRALLSLAAIPFLAGMMYVTWYTIGRVQSMPTPFRVPGLLAYQKMVYYSGPRQAPAFKPAAPPRLPHIVLIVDESIMSTHLSINGYSRDTTPYLASLGERLCNLGIASSGGNSSYTSQGILFSGLTPADLPDKNFQILKKPSLAQYAQQAGYRFTFFDGQNYSRLVKNAREAVGKDFTYRVWPAGRDVWHCDPMLAQDLVQFIKTSERSVSYFAKLGAHWPYDRRCPPEQRSFTPIVNSTNWSFDVQANRNSYDNAVAYNCDQFFKGLLPELDALGKDVLVIYTSDHGQALPGTLPGRMQTHCGVDLPNDSAAVPILVWGSGSGKELAKELAANKSLLNNCSHFEIFPTLLVLMGYDKQQVANEYGASLLDELPAGRTREYLGGMIENSIRSRMVEFKPGTLRR